MQEAEMPQERLEEEKFDSFGDLEWRDLDGSLDMVLLSEQILSVE